MLIGIAIPIYLPNGEIKSSPSITGVSPVKIRSTRGGIDFKSIKPKKKPKPKPVVYYSTPVGCTGVRNIFTSLGVTGNELNAAMQVVIKESSCNHTIANRYSGAYGLPQALPGYKMASHGADWRTNPRTQLRWMISYVRGRYGSFQAAYRWQLNHGWY